MDLSGYGNNLIIRDTIHLFHCYNRINILVFIGIHTFRFRIKSVDTFKISLPELVIIFVSGLVRGSVGFALVQFVINEFDERKGTKDPNE